MGINNKGFLTLSPIKFVKEEKLPKTLKPWPPILKKIFE